MIFLKDYIKRDFIIFYLCRIRSKLAKNRNKSHLLHLITTNPRYNYHNRSLNKNEEEITKLFPPRKTWKKLGPENRGSIAKPLNSVDKNIKSLLYTISGLEKKHPDNQAIKSMDNFVNSITTAIYSKNYKIGNPIIYPKPKDDDKELPLKCRPISLFNLKDKIIICLVNKYLTDLFDKYFYTNSLAFRSRRNIDGLNITPNHHDALKSIAKYISAYPNGNLWVAECDMMKFYDSVRHYTIKRHFDELCKKVKKDNRDQDLQFARSIFFNYLDCYSFTGNVLPLNKDITFFNRHGISSGSFEWIERDLEKKCYYKSFIKEKIGVPQGGALSGLIANIVLDHVDKEVLKTGDQDLFYVRYCDDMLIVHPDKQACTEAYKRYLLALRDLKLIPHPSLHLQEYSKEFWKAKSKNPYLWGRNTINGSPWIGFVGYEINRDGEIRVRKKSLKKEMKKQYETINSIRQAIKHNTKRARNRSIEESAINKLIGSSVGRVKIWNFGSMYNDMCWVKGFSQLNNNKSSMVQIKRLDACRNKLIRKLKKDLSKSPEIEKKEGHIKRKQILYYGKPFSYYYHVFEKEPYA